MSIYIIAWPNVLFLHAGRVLRGVTFCIIFAVGVAECIVF